MASPPAPIPAEVAGNHGPSITAAVLVVAILASIAVALRFVARYIQRIGYGVDDILILVALPLAWGVAICTLISVHYGLGKHIGNVPLHHLVKEAQAYYASEIIWASTILFIKLSILSLYVRIFGRLVYLRRLAYGFGTFVSCWTIMVIFVLAFQCHPVEFNWNKSIKGTCINQWIFFVIGSTPNVVTDFAILIIPLPAVWALKMRAAQRLSIIGIFLLGSLTCVISLVRLATIGRSKNLTDATWAPTYVSIWSCAEPCLGIVAACLPTLRPLFKNSFATPMGSKERAVAKYGSSEFRSGGTGNIKSMRPGDSHPFQYLGDSTDETTGVAYSASATSAGDKISGSATENIPMNTIAVNTSWENRRGAL